MTVGLYAVELKVYSKKLDIKLGLYIIVLFTCIEFKDHGTIVLFLFLTVDYWY